MKKKKLKQATTPDVCYAIINVFLDGKADGLERSKDLNFQLREACQKILALKIGLETACKLGELDQQLIERESLKQVMKFAPGGGRRERN